MHWSVILTYRDALINGLVVTVQITVCAAIGAFVLGVILAFLRQLPVYVLKRLVDAYVEFIRNIPAIVKVFFLYFVMGWEGWQSAVVGLAIHQSAYICDALDAGFRSVPREQSEASWALGHSRFATFRFVLLPQIWVVSLPSITNQLIEVLKNSSIVMLIGVQELTFQAQQIEADTFRGFEAATVVTAIYIMLAFGIAGGASWFERKVARR
ncbi:HisM ABC-type amino acid transport system, permease component [Burkholderiaceae bacterium]|jgi:polar amino acid transport system permease protein